MATTRYRSPDYSEMEDYLNAKWRFLSVMFFTSYTTGDWECEYHLSAIWVARQG